MNKVRNTLIASLLLIALTSIASCAGNNPPEISYFEVVGTQARRVEVITAMLAKFHELPTPIMDAQFVEEKIGDDELGPADYRAFTLLEIAPENVAAWQDILILLDTMPNYATPSQPISWWVDEDTFATLQFYTPDTLTGRTNGWIAIDPQNGKIYLYSYTT